VADHLGHLVPRPEVADVRTSVIYEHLRNNVIIPDPAANH